MYSTVEDIESQNRNFNSVKMLHSTKSPSRSGSGSGRRKDVGGEFDEQKLIRLCLKKPENWKWELTTDASNANFNFPTIQLMDENKEILTEVSAPGACVKSTELKRSKSSSLVVKSRSKSRSVKYSPNKTSLLKLETPALELKTIDSTDLNDKEEPTSARIIDEKQPIGIYSERGLVIRDYNAKEFKAIREKCEKLLENQSSTEKDACPSNNKNDIENKNKSISKSKTRSSSSEEEGGNGDDKKNRHKRPSRIDQQYSLRTCNVGTIIVPKESFSKYPRRRRRADAKESHPPKDDVNNNGDEIITDKHNNNDNNDNSHENDDKCSLRNSNCCGKGFAIKKSLSSDVVSDKLKDRRNKKCKSHKNHTIYLDSANLPTETVNEEGNDKSIAISNLHPKQQKLRNKEIDINRNDFIDVINEYGGANKSADDVFLLLVKRLTSLKYNNNSNSQQQQESLGINYSNSNRLPEKQQKQHQLSSFKPSEVENNNKFNKNSKLQDNAHKDIGKLSETKTKPIEEIVVSENQSKDINQNPNQTQDQNMGSNVSRPSLGKGLSGRRTQSSSNIDSHAKQSLANGICCATSNQKYSATKLFHKNNHSHDTSDKSSFFNNNNNTTIINNSNTGKTVENFDNVLCNQPETTTATATATLKPKKCHHSNNQNNIKSKDRNKFHGSLPNHLDTDIDYEGSSDTNSSVVQTPQSKVFNLTENNVNSQNAIVRKFDEIYQQQHRLQLEPFIHQKQQNHSFRITNTYARENFIRSQETNSFRIPQASTNRVKFQPYNKIIAPAPSVKTIDQCYDQGYGSERSPEDELPPPLPIFETNHYNTLLMNQTITNQMFYNCGQSVKFNYQQLCQEYDFISEDCIFNVEIIKGPRGLGLSVSGGVDSTAPFPGLVRIKRLFPHQSAWATGKLQPGDILLEANGIPLTGLTNNEALEVLRTMENVVTLLICRPHDEKYRKLSPPTAEPPKPPMRSSFNYKYPYMLPLDPIQTNFSGEFEIVLTKHNGSLGFTLQKEDESVLGHYVRALVREPATTNGRIKAGDKIVAVNDIPISSLTHEQAVIFLRQAPDTVKLRLYRDGGQTPISGMSPKDPEYKVYSGGTNTLSKKTKQALRPEAINLLTDLAHKKNAPQSSNGNSTNSSFRSSPNGTSSSPRRLRKATPHSNKNSSSTGESSSFSDNNANSSDSTLQSSTSISTNQAFMMSSESASCSGSGAVTPFSDSSLDTPTVISSLPKAKHPPNSLKYYDPHELSDIAPDDDNEGYYDDEEIEAAENQYRPNRPNFLNLAGQSGSTPTVPRKPAFQFSIATANAYELNNLDGVLDAPINYKLSCDNYNDSQDDTLVNSSSSNNNFTSLPCETLLLACKTEHDLRNSVDDSDTCLYVKGFNKQNPMYQSAQVQITHHKKEDSDSTGDRNLLKWKGVTLSSNDDEKPQEKTEYSEESEAARNSQRIAITNVQADLNFDDLEIDSNENAIITVELQKGWNSRLGFSLKNEIIPPAEKQITLIRAIYSDSVAAKDGRLCVGDRILMVNDEIVADKSTTEIIDLLRIIRGSICITVARKKQKQAEETLTEIQETSDEAQQQEE